MQQTTHTNYTKQKIKSKPSKKRIEGTDQHLLTDIQNKNVLTVLQKYLQLQKMKKILTDQSKINEHFSRDSKELKNKNKRPQPQQNIQKQIEHQTYNEQNRNLVLDPQDDTYHPWQKNNYNIYSPIGPLLFPPQPFITFPHYFQLQRMDIDPKYSNLSIYLQNQLLKANQQILKIQTLINYSPKDKNKQIYINSSQQSNLFSHIAYSLNNLILLTNFILCKFSYKQEQLHFSFEQSQHLYTQLREQYLKLETKHQMLLQSNLYAKQSSQSSENELHRLKSVIESYQLENHDIRDELNILRQVIEEMNKQVEIGEKKLNEKRRQTNMLKQELQKISIYAHELELQIQQHEDVVGELKILQSEVFRLEKEEGKWKNRCFQQIELEGRDAKKRKQKNVIRGSNRFRTGLYYTNMSQVNDSETNGEQSPKGKLKKNKIE